MTTKQPEQPTSATHFATVSLLSTIGVAQGGLALDPNAATALGERARRGGADVQDDAARRVPDLLNMACTADTHRLVSAAFGGDPILLSRCDFVIEAGLEAQWHIAGKSVRGQSAMLRAILGVSHWISLGDASMDVSTASRRLPASQISPAPGSRCKTIALTAGQSVFLGRGTRFRLGQGTWLGLDYVRAWMKPDILFASALPQPILDALDPALPEVLGAHISLPTSVDAFIEAEAAAARGELANISGRGV
ncbi:hypothetical protein [Roseibium aggregatum]|uniref:hypothetical protein n=1 Tax=Roseibium aggregatum TaxID=187304 RepID=UPI0025AD3FAA|nr:hypothetical protein [Roseibium aggregatum]WJS05554.1 hypothetical protein QUB73_26810 [Roseibium aggregatum]